MKIKVIGKITPKTENILSISKIEDKNIYIGNSNFEHMMKKHPEDFKKYGNKLEDILNSPDYVGLNPKDDSIEFVKEYIVNNDFVKVAVRISNNDKYFVRSLYVLNNNRVQNFIDKNKLKKY